MNPIAEQLEQVDRDLVEVDEQVAAGELDEATAAELRASYRAEAERLRSELASVDDTTAAAGRSGKRIMAGALVLGVGALVIVVAAVVSLRDRAPGGNLTGGVASDVVAGEGVDLSQISDEQMEAVVAENPDIVPMRLALARRYFEAGEFDRALPHYMHILETQQVSHPEALANVGWMTALSGVPDVGRTFVERALEIEPDFPQAYWFLANIDVALGDETGAAAALDRLLGYEDIPSDIRSQAEELRAEVGP